MSKGRSTVKSFVRGNAHKLTAGFQASILRSNIVSTFWQPKGLSRLALWQNLDRTGKYAAIF
jgi:hypothetical protein